MKRYDYISLLKGFKKIGLKQEFVASEIGVAQASISRWTNKESEPSIENYFSIVELARQNGLITEDEIERSNGARRLDLIDEIDTFAGLGGGGLSIINSTAENGVTFHRESVRDVWRLPEWMLGRFNARPHHIKAFPSRGDSMTPTISDGDVIFIDTRHQVPSPPGIYALADEFGGVIVKRLEVVSRPGDDEITVRISSDNPRHGTRDLLLSEINIIGRYVGRFTI